MNWIEILATVVTLVAAIVGGLAWFIKVTLSEPLERLRHQQGCNYFYLAERLNDIIDRLNLVTEELFDNGRSRPIDNIPTEQLPYCRRD